MSSPHHHELRSAVPERPIADQRVADNAQLSRAMTAGIYATALLQLRLPEMQQEVQEHTRTGLAARQRRIAESHSNYEPRQNKRRPLPPTQFDVPRQPQTPLPNEPWVETTERREDIISALTKRATELSEDDVKNLSKVASDGREAREKLVRSNYPLVEYVVNHLRSRGASDDEMAEMRQEGLYGLTRAIDRFDPSIATLGTFAPWHIRGAILHARRSKSARSSLSIEQPYSLGDKTIKDRLTHAEATEVTDLNESAIAIGAAIDATVRRLSTERRRGPRGYGTEQIANLLRMRHGLPPYEEPMSLREIVDRTEFSSPEGVRMALTKFTNELRRTMQDENI